ncbi:MAG: SIS domain-containing protein [Chitinophagales bacterium]|nr:SIS domain-containing protein [Chitinophagales bacterium]
MKNKIQHIIQESVLLKQKLLADKNTEETVEHLVVFLSQKLKKEQAVYLCGNGGSAADALHIAAEFSGRFYLNRKALPVEALNVNMAAITAISNDYGFENVFARMLEAKATKGDVLWVFSTSGQSKNIIKVAEKAKEMGVAVVSFTGQKESILDSIADFSVKIPSEITPRIQECHLLLGHIICELVEQKLFNE